MMRRFVSVLITGCLCSATALADGVETLPSQTNVDVSLSPAPGLVPLRITVTQSRRVFVRDTAATQSTRAPALRYMCTTPCRLYVRPGAVDVTLIGWGAHEYRWEVPAHGGAVNLAARLPTGALAPLPWEGEFASQVADAQPAMAPSTVPSIPASEATANHEILALHAGMVIGAVGGAGLALAHSLAMLDTVARGDTSSL